jgi:hypothetical protein
MMTVYTRHSISGCHLCSMTFMLSVIHKPFCSECPYAECRYAECRGALFVAPLSCLVAHNSLLSLPLSLLSLSLSLSLLLLSLSLSLFLSSLSLLFPLSSFSLKENKPLEQREKMTMAVKKIRNLRTPVVIRIIVFETFILPPSVAFFCYACLKLKIYLTKFSAENRKRERENRKD